MQKDKLTWCCKQKKGVALIDAKLHLSESYIIEADDTLENVTLSTGKWKLITAYYACYNALYAILMKCGIKCEIHECTIELMALFDFEPFEIEFLKQLKDDRIQTQYYLKKIELKDENTVKKFVLKCKTIINSLTSNKIEEIRKIIELK